VGSKKLPVKALVQPLAIPSAILWVILSAQAIP
jgi:hypothetical protein